MVNFEAIKCKGQCTRGSILQAGMNKHAVRRMEKEGLCIKGAETQMNLKGQGKEREVKNERSLYFKGKQMMEP